ncbi:MAG: ComEA family DNA-binding protein [Ignavibacteriaceae bacterium]
MKFFFLFSLVLLLTLPYQAIHSQTDSTSSIYHIDDIEHFLNPEEETSDDNDLLDVIESLLANPLKLNEVTRDQLCEIPFLDLNTAKIIIDYRNKNGRFFSVSELRMIPGLDSYLIDKISGFFIIAPVTSPLPLKDKLKKQTKKGHPLLHLRSRLLTKPNILLGDDSELASGYKSYSRITLKTDFLEFSGLIEKDFAEKNHMDFFSGGISLTGLSPFSNITIGDFIISHGHSLLLSSPFPIRKSSSIFAVHRTPASNSRLYRSSSESKFLRGISLSLPLSISVSGISFSSLTLFATVNSFDAILDTSGAASSIDFDGIHSTQISQSRKHNFRENLAGSLLAFSISDQVHLAVLSTLSSFDKTLSLPESQSIPNDKLLSSNSLAYDFALSNLSFSGELVFSLLPERAASFAENLSQIHSLFFSPAKGISLQASVRNYSSSFISLHSAPFYESSTFPWSEFGIYTALLVSTPIGRFSLFFDQFLLRGDLNGYDSFLEYNTRLSPKFLMLFRLRFKSKEYITSGLEHDIISRTKKLTLRSEFSYRILTPLRLRTRLDFSFLREPSSAENTYSSGFLFFQDFSYYYSDFLGISARFLFYDTDDFSAAIYEFENDLPGLMTIKPLYGEGFRYYLMTNFTFFNNLLVTFKYSETYKSPVPNSTVLNRTSSEFNLQLDLKF